MWHTNTNTQTDRHMMIANSYASIASQWAKTLMTRKLCSIEDWGPTDRVSNWDKVMQVKVNNHLVQKLVWNETNGQTDRWTKANALAPVTVLTWSVKIYRESTRTALQLLQVTVTISFEKTPAQFCSHAVRHWSEGHGTTSWDLWHHSHNRLVQKLAQNIHYW